MRLFAIVAYTLAGASIINAVSIPDAQSLSIRDSGPSANLIDRFLSPHNALERRKGGGGKSGGGGGGKSSGGGTPSNAKSNSNSGGRTVSGSGVTPGYGGGRYYGGGATVPYSAGQRSPLGLAPFLILPIAALAIFPGLWLYGIYSYPYTHPYTFVNQTAVNSTYPNGVNQTRPIICLCQEYSVCGCDDNTDTQYLGDLIGNGSYAGLNKTLVTVAEVNGTTTIVINGTLPNGTTASGGTDSAAPRVRMLEFSGWWMMIAVVLCTVSFL